MTKRGAVAELESFSDEEAATAIYDGGDRPTPIYEAPANLVRYSRPHEGSVVAPLPTDSGIQPRSIDTGAPVRTYSGVQPLGLHSEMQAPATPPEPVAEPAAAGEAHESEFWDSAPRYSTTSLRPPGPASLAPPRHQPSRTRRVLAKLLFGVAFAGVLTLLGYEVSVFTGVSLSAFLR